MMRVDPLQRHDARRCVLGLGYVGLRLVAAERQLCEEVTNPKKPKNSQ